MGEVVEHPGRRRVANVAPVSPASPALAAIEQLREAITGSPWAVSAGDKARLENAIDRLVIETMGLDGGQAARLQRLTARIEAQDALVCIMEAPALAEARRAAEADAHRRALELGARLADQRRSRAFVQWMPRRSLLERLRRLWKRRASLLERIFPDAA